MKILWRIAPALLAFAFSAPALAEIVSSTDVSYFTVDGNTLAEIYRDILDRGPRVSGERALASIGTLATQDGGLTEENGSCRVTGYVISLTFKIRRPRIANEKVLPGEERAMWKQMNGFIAAHEDEHKAVWLACARDLDQKITALSAPTCAELLMAGEALWQQMLSACDAKQRSFDAQQSRTLMQQPFMLRALKAAE